MTDMPRFGDLLKLTKDDWQEMPDSPSPYYIGAKDGLFAVRRLLFGRGIARILSWPDNFRSVGTSTGQFMFDAPVIPAKMMAQIVSFFQNVYTIQKTEAAVLLTMHTQTKEWGVFIPTQLVSHGGVNYVYDPQHIRGDRIVVGSIHSHADFNPFHSGTDTGDAADFDGFHCTIGYVDKVPKIVAMVSMNKQNMHYKEADFPSLFDWSEVGQHKAPEWWLNYVGTGNDKPVGFELYKKFEKPTAIKTENAPKGVQVYRAPIQTPNGSYYDANWNRDNDEARQMMSDWGMSHGYGGGSENRSWSKPWWAGRSAEWLAKSGYIWDEKIESYRWVGNSAVHQVSEPTDASKEFNARKEAERGVKWEKDGTLKVRKLSRKQIADLTEAFSKTDYWEDHLDREVVEAIVDSHCFTEDDADDAADNPETAGDIAYWQELFVRKALGAVIALRAMNIDANLILKSTTASGLHEQEWVLPDPQTEEVHHGVH